MIPFKHDGYALAMRALAEAIKPPVPMEPSVWAAANLIVPDGPRAGQSFDLSLTPYLAEPVFSSSRRWRRSRRIGS
jgi:hypothetical protein